MKIVPTMNTKPTSLGIYSSDDRNKYKAKWQKERLQSTRPPPETSI